MSDDLVTLGTGQGSSNETLKADSRYLRGSLAESLAEPTTHFAEDDVQLLKFHGSYQQEDRDQRQARKAAGIEKAYQMMIRSRIPGGILTPEQYLAHDEIADRYANGTLRLTTRQGIQLHGVLKSNLRATIKGINDTLLSTLAACGDVNRNVMACPAPTAGRARTQVEEYAHRIAVHLAPQTKAYHEIWLDGEQLETGVPVEDDEPIYGKTYLPRKFKIGIAYPGDNCVDVYTQDIGLIAAVEDGELAGFTLVVGGGMGSTHGKKETYARLATPLCFARPDDVIEIVETIVTIQRDYGDRKNRKHARMKYLIEEQGIPWFRAELEQRLGRPVENPRDVEFVDAEDHLGWHDHGAGVSYLGIFVENGRVADKVTSLVRSALRDVVREFRPGVRITGQQNIILTDIPTSERARVEERFRSYGVETDPVALGVRRHSMACPAMPTCGLAVAEAERALPDLVTQVQYVLLQLGIGNEPLSIRMTGCPNGCARPRMGDIGLVGRSLDLYDVFFGGDVPNTRMNTLYAKGVKRQALIETIRPALELWRRRRSEHESFGDFVTRYGIDNLRETVSTEALEIA